MKTDVSLAGSEGGLHCLNSGVWLPLAPVATAFGLCNPTHTHTHPQDAGVKTDVSLAGSEGGLPLRAVHWEALEGGGKEEGRPHVPAGCTGESSGLGSVSGW